MVDASKRSKDGKFLPGGVGNPTGANGITPWQRYGIRAAHWLEKLTLQELKDLCEGPEFNQLSSYDTLILSNIYRAHFSEDVRQERDSLLNRVEGKPKETVHHEGQVAHQHHHEQDYGALDRYIQGLGEKGKKK